MRVFQISTPVLITVFLIGVAFANRTERNFAGPGKNHLNKTTQMRVFTINKGKMDLFVDAWLKGVYPLRLSYGFKIEGAWVVQDKNKFVWILSYDGPEGFKAKDSMYYASTSRKTMDPDPVQYIADVEYYFLNEAPVP